MENFYIPRAEYPRPQFMRGDNTWKNLNGKWEFELDLSASGAERHLERAEHLSSEINVPFAPESELSGIGYTDFIPSVWYKRSFTLDAENLSGRVLLHFGAVDDKATVWRADVWDVLKNATGYPVDLIYADPPYREVDIPKLLEAIDGSSFANDDTIVIIEHDETVKCAKDTEICSWRCYRSISYGKAQVSLFGRIGSFKSEEEE